jgi:2-(1,2-epoxy-1,2-dihydrophenyl)acetyl-CoA isomerase
MAEPPVLADRRAGYRVITLNRPTRLNAFDATMHLALAEAVTGRETDPSCRAVLLTGAGRGFCAG